MTLARVNKGAFNSSAGFGTGAFTTTAFTPSDNSLLVAVLRAINHGASGDVSAGLTISDSLGTLTWTSRIQTPNPSNWKWGARIFTAPITTGASMTVSADCGAIDIERYRVEIYEYTGHDTTTPIGATATGSDADGNGAASITLSGAPATDSEVLAGADVAQNSGDGATTEGTGWTEIADFSHTGWINWQTQSRTASTSTNVAWADLDTGADPLEAVMWALEIKAAGGGGGDVSGNLTGSGVTSSAGTVSAATSKALSGSALSSAQGSTSPATGKALSGAVLASASGTMVPDLQIALTGQSLSFAQGDLTASTGADVTVSLSGQVLTASQGALAPATSLALSGAALTGAQGDVTAVTGVTVQLTGQALSLAQGALTSDITSLLQGEAMRLSQGSVALPVLVTDSFSGGFLYEYEREIQRRARRRRELEELEEKSKELQDEVDREIALLLRAKESEEERRAELDRLQRLVATHSKERLELSDRARIAYVRAFTQANFSAMEALDRELQRQIEEEDTAVLMLLLNE